MLNVLLLSTYWTPNITHVGHKVIDGRLCSLIFFQTLNASSWARSGGGASLKLNQYAVIQAAGELMNKSKITIDYVLTNIYRLSMHLKRRCLPDLT